MGEKGNRGGEISDRIFWRKRYRSGKPHRIISSRETIFPKERRGDPESALP